MESIQKFCLSGEGKPSIPFRLEMIRSVKASTMSPKPRERLDLTTARVASSTALTTPKINR